MRDFYIILNYLQENRIPFCFQCQGDNDYFNISINDPKGKNHSYSAENFRDIERFVYIMWGHKVPKKEVILSMPLPSNFPIPRPM